jgi:predicted O-methyltransferase YrrM
LSITEFFTAIYRAPSKQRLRLMRGLLPFLAKHQLEVAPVGTCEFSSLEAYPDTFARLSELIGDPEQLPAPGELAFLHSIVNRTVHYGGAIGPQDYFFLTAVSSILAPRRVLEIGTSSGFSSALMAAALHRRHPQLSGALVETIDLHRNYFVDPTKPIGFEIAELLPEQRDAVRVHTGHGSELATELAAAGQFEFAFIDADHQHPWPLLDLLRVAPYLQENGWIALHDIQLGTIGAKAANSGHPLPYGARFGAEWLFEHWPFRKISGGNIGVIQLPVDRTGIIPTALKLMELPFEMSAGSHRRMSRALYRAIGNLLDAS